MSGEASSGPGPVGPGEPGGTGHPGPRPRAGGADRRAGGSGAVRSPVRRRAASWLLAAGVLLGATPVAAEPVGGGGGRKQDCLVVFDAPVNDPPDRPRHVRCTDGDPACDADATIDGVCTVQLRVCIGSSFDAACSRSGVESILVEHSFDNGDPRFDPDFQAVAARIAADLALPSAASDLCTGVATVRVPIRGPLPRDRCRRGKKLLRLTGIPTDPQGPLDRDKLKLLCEPAADPCDPRDLFAGTFDRIARQIFGPSCALGGCHDSQSRAGGLLLERAGAYSELVDRPPVNPAAAAAGWLRVRTLGAGSGDPETSFLHHKLEGDLGSGMGARMPFLRKKLPRYLRDLVELWILHGAPETGWVPGTD